MPRPFLRPPIMVGPAAAGAVATPTRKPPGKQLRRGRRAVRVMGGKAGSRAPADARRRADAEAAYGTAALGRPRKVIALVVVREKAGALMVEVACGMVHGGGDGCRYSGSSSDTGKSQSYCRDRTVAVVAAAGGRHSPRCHRFV